MSERCTRLRRGDANGDRKLDLTDAIVVLDQLFLGGKALPCEDASDVDDSGNLDLTDALSILRFLFQGGPVPTSNRCRRRLFGKSCPCSRICPVIDLPSENLSNCLC